MLEGQLDEALLSLENLKDVLSHYGETAEFVVRPLGYVLLVSALENDSLNPGRIELLAKVYEKAGLDFEKEFGALLALEEDKKLATLKEKGEIPLREYDEEIRKFAGPLYQKRRKWVAYQDNLMLIADAFGSAERVYPEWPNNALVRPVFEKLVQPIIDLNEK